MTENRLTFLYSNVIEAHRNATVWIGGAV